MGNFFSAICSAITPCLAEQAKYIYHLDDNLKALDNVIERLRARSHDVEDEVAKQERQGLQQLEEVRVWLSQVEKIGSQVNLLLKDRSVELGRLSMCGICSNNFRLTYSYAKKVSKVLKEVQLLLSSSPGEVATKGLPPLMVEGPTQHTIGLEEMLESTWELLKKDEVGILGLYGLGGVGKTTILNQINNKFFETKENFYVIYVVVSHDLQIGEIQRKIGERLGIHNTEWEQRNKMDKASDINKALRRNKFVLLLDDIWSKVDLEDIGVPLPNKENRSKVVFTTRSKVVCGRMGALEMEVECLKPENAWKLFERKVGAITLESDPRIPKLARIVCGKCEGLPLALTSIGGTMACKRTVIEWQHAIDVLNSNAAEYQEVEDDILKILKLSYDYLNSEMVKQCFLYCTLFPEDHCIIKSDLVDYWLCEGFINGGEDREVDIRHGNEIISTLVNACLLMNDIELQDVAVKMHDVVRQMALWIASNCGKEEEKFVVKTGAKLHQMPDVREWNAVTRMSLANNEIQNISVTPECSKLKTLILRNNELENISGEFFQTMPKLLVLDLSYNKGLTNLPEEISNLVSLRYLNLEGTKLKNLPEGLRKLIQLICLDLTGVKTLASISVVSSLINIETLHVGSSTYLSLDLIEDMKSLKYLKVLSVRIDNDFVVLEHLLSIPSLARCIQDITLVGIEEINLSFALATPRLRFLSIKRCSILDIKENTRIGFRSPRAIRFQDLATVMLMKLSGIQDLTWLLFAPSLTNLYIVGPSIELQEIISRGKVSGIMNEEGSSMRPFANLRVLWLKDLVELKSIYWDALEFPNLMTFTINECPNLKRLPLNTDSAKRNDFRLCVDSEEWLDSVEWEDEETRYRFWHLTEVKNYNYSQGFQGYLQSTLHTPFDILRFARLSMLRLKACEKTLRQACETTYLSTR